MVAYIVVKTFADLEDKRRLYEVGHPYPREGVEPTPERIEALTSSDNNRGEPVIKVVEDPENEDQEDQEFPTHKGGGNYELSNGEKVRGKAAAIEAEDKLKSGE